MLQTFKDRLRPRGSWLPGAPMTRSMWVSVPKLKPGSRRVAMATRGHNSATVVDPNDGFAKQLESDVEHSAFLLFTADPSIVSIVCQAPPIEYVNADGEFKEHFFDFLIERTCGRKEAVMAKDEEGARLKDVESLANLLAGQLPPDFADGVVLITKGDMPEWLVSNARLIRSCRMEQPNDDDEAIEAFAANTTGPISVHELCKAAAPRGFRAVARLIFRGVLQQVSPGLIKPETLVKFAKATSH